MSKTFRAQDLPEMAKRFPTFYMQRFKVHELYDPHLVTFDIAIVTIDAQRSGQDLSVLSKVTLERDANHPSSRLFIFF